MNFNTSFAILFLRLILGFIFFMQGYGKVFSIGVENLFHSDFFYETYKDILPSFIIKSTAFYTSYIELIAGAMLIVGFKKEYALFALASVLVIVTFGHGLAEPVWDLSHVVFRTLLLVPLLLLQKDMDKFSLDNFLIKKK